MITYRQFLDELDAMGVAFTIKHTAAPWSAADHWNRDPATNDRHLKRFRLGRDAVLGLMGDACAVCDVDPRNGGDIEKVRALLAHLGVRIFAEVKTPGGGVHFLVAGHPALRTRHFGSDHPEWPGLDIQSHGTLVFLPGSTRFDKGYAGQGYEIVFADLAALAEGDAEGSEALMNWLDEVDPVGEPAEVSDLYDGHELTTLEKDYLASALAGERDRLAMCAEGRRNQRLNDSAYALGRLVAGAGLDESEVRRELTAAAKECGLVSDDGIHAVHATLRSGLNAGKRNPRCKPPSDDELLGIDTMPLVSRPGSLVGSDESSEGKTATKAGRVKLWKAADLAPSAQPKWLARGRIPVSAVSLLTGDEGKGKSTWWVWLVALVTTGAAFEPFGIPAREPQNVILVLTEDDWSTTVRPRLEVAGADIARVYVICAEPDGSGSPVLPGKDMALLDNPPPFALLVVDAWLDVVPDKYNVKDPQAARLALHPWRELATRLGVAVLLVTHTNRVQSADSRDRYGITSELRKKARSTLFAQHDDEGRLVVGPDKANLAGVVPASVFRVEPVQFWEPANDDDGTVGRVVYVGESDHTATEHARLNHENRDSDAQDCREWLQRFMDDNRGSCAASDVSKAAEAEGYGRDALKTAKRRLHIASRKQGERWLWTTTG
ncbi:AAA family ATPase [Nocardia cyriacigeorgica]|uniref:AAA family ATPase n=1 Tax=Nocardia cyriacigeorgica TaxID=135487 RepID=UPI0013BCDD56|nr:AAA family ATPase [Nocardia cyriacigeorgica]NEW49955.1 AAA family ATPase [Nocardia cyriacigeorgica]